jgi:hypothetical protein
MNVYESARSGWLSANIEESRPLWSLARTLDRSQRPAAARLHILSDRPLSERVRSIPDGQADDNTLVTFQVWDLTRLKRIHDSMSVRDDLVVDLTFLPEGGLKVLPAANSDADYRAYLAVIPGECLAEIYARHGSRLLEGNVRTFLGRRGNVNKGIGRTLANEPSRFFAYNNGIAATASDIEVKDGSGAVLITSAADLQIVNGAQTTASLAAAHRDGRLPRGCVFIPMKLSVVPLETGEELIPLISRYANSQNAVRASDFFSNHPFHRRVEEMSRRILAPATEGSQVQTHWYYERARGQYLNDQAGLTRAKRDLFQRVNPRHQLITKTDLAKVECSFDLIPDVACKGAEKAFTAFADRTTKDWTDESKRAAFSDDWFRAAVARVILFRTAEKLVSRSPWYEGGYRAQIVAYTCACLAILASKRSHGGRLDYRRIWNAQVAGEVLERQLLAIAEVMAQVLRSPPQAGQNISEWAKQQACRKSALETPVPVVEGFDGWVIGEDDARAEEKERREQGKVADGLAAVTEVMKRDAIFWQNVRRYCRERRLLTHADEKALVPACAVPTMIPSDFQAARLLALLARAKENGWEEGDDLVDVGNSSSASPLRPH